MSHAKRGGDEPRPVTPIRRGNSVLELFLSTMTDDGGAAFDSAFGNADATSKAPPPIDTAGLAVRAWVTWPAQSTQYTSGLSAQGPRVSSRTILAVRTAASGPRI